MNKICDYINKTDKSEKKPMWARSQQDDAMHARPHQGTAPAQNACCVHMNSDGGGAIGCEAPPTEV